MGRTPEKEDPVSSVIIRSNYAHHLHHSNRDGLLFLLGPVLDLPMDHSALQTIAEVERLFGETFIAQHQSSLLVTRTAIGFQLETHPGRRAEQHKIAKAATPTWKRTTKCWNAWKRRWISRIDWCLNFFWWYKGSCHKLGTGLRMDPISQRPTCFWRRRNFARVVHERSVWSKLGVIES